MSAALSTAATILEATIEVIKMFLAMTDTATASQATKTRKEPESHQAIQKLKLLLVAWL